MKGLTEEEAQAIEAVVADNDPGFVCPGNCACEDEDVPDIEASEEAIGRLVARGLLCEQACAYGEDSFHQFVTPPGLAMLALCRSGQMRAA